MQINEKKMDVINHLDEGIDLAFFDEKCELIKSKLKEFDNNGFSSTMFILGAPGFGKTYTVRRAIREAKLNDVTVVNIDCRIYDNDRTVSKEFLRQIESQKAQTLLDAIRQRGSIILIFDHFDSMKIVKRQFFLYQIFNSKHENSISLFVILLVSSIEPLSDIEKRVKSRLSPLCIEFPKADSLIIKKNGKSESLFELSKTVNKKSPIMDIMKGLNDTNSLLFKKAQQIYEIFPSLLAVFDFVKKLVVLSPNHHIDESKAEDICKEYLSFTSPARFIDACNQLELTLLLIAQYIMETNNYNGFTFDELFNQFKQQLVSSMFVKKITEGQAKVAWNRLISSKLIVPIDNNQIKATLAVVSNDIELFIKKVPTEINQWTKSKIARK